MKKRNLTFLLLFISMHLMAPPLEKPTLYIEAPTSINFFDEIRGFEPLIEAVVRYESRGNPFAYNAKENAVGAFQIRQCRIEDYNNQMGTNYVLEDCYDYNLSKRIFLYFAKDKDFEHAAKDWNGSGPMTEIYWENVKKLI